MALVSDRVKETAAWQPDGRGALGFTLAEVLIAVALLTVGIFAALRIFPGGLSAIQLNRNRMLAARLAEQEIQRLKARLEGVPDAIVASESQWVESDNKYVLDFQADYDPRDLRADEKQPLWLPTSASLPRTILGESVRIGQAPWRFTEASDKDFAVLPVVALSFTPIAHLHNKREATDPEDPRYAEPLVVYSSHYQGISDLQVLARPPASMDSGRYCIDYQKGTLSFDHVAGRARTFRVQYQWYKNVSGGSQGPQVIREWLESVDVGDGEDTVEAPKALSAASQPAFQGVVWGSESVHLAFRREAGLNNIDAPDEFWLGSMDGRAGVEALADGRSDLALVFSADNAGKTVKVDYRVRDWSIISEEHTVPESRRIKLTLTRLKPLDYTNPPRQLGAQGIDDDVGASAIALDLETGERFLGGNWPEQDPEAAPPGRLRVDFTTGTVTFPAGSVGKSYRIHYRAEDDWTLQVMKPAREYDVSSPAPLAEPAPGYREYVWDAESADDEARREVVFALADLDKSVGVDYWTTVDGKRQNVKDEIHRIEAPGQAGAGSTAVIYLDRVPDQNSALDVRGVSLHARVVWVAHLGSRSIQGTGLGERWLEKSVGTFAAGGAAP
jgi:type II secretory pathway pseudopilin PulG